MHLLPHMYILLFTILSCARIIPCLRPVPIVTPVMLLLNDTKSSDMEIVLGTSNLNPLSEIEIHSYRSVDLESG
jgi:hypothetical protein